MVAFTTNLVTTEVGIDPVSGNIWYFTGGISGTMVNVGTAPVGPLNTAAPVISGALVHGSAMSCTTGTWNVTGTYSYQWYSGGVAVPGATASSYTTATGDVGKMITCTVGLTNAAGTGFAASNALGPVT